MGTTGINTGFPPLTVPKAVRPVSRLVTWPKEGELAVQRFFEGGKAHSRYSDICDRVRPHHLHRPLARA